MDNNTAATKTQNRATCPACFATQAIRANGRMVPHGYTRPQSWHSNVNECVGTGKPHFGTPEGRDYTASLAKQLVVSATEWDEQAVRVADPTTGAGVFGPSNGRHGAQQIADPTPRQRERYAQHLRDRAVHLRTMAIEFTASAASWIPKAPIVVPVEAKVTLVHLRTSKIWGGQGKACAGSIMGAMRGGWNSSREVVHVTCPRCLALAPRFADPQEAR